MALITAQISHRLDSATRLFHLTSAISKRQFTRLIKSINKSGPFSGLTFNYSASVFCASKHSATLVYISLFSRRFAAAFCNARVQSSGDSRTHLTGKIWQMTIRRVWLFTETRRLNLELRVHKIDITYTNENNKKRIINFQFVNFNRSIVRAQWSRFRSTSYRRAHVLFALSICSEWRKFQSVEFTFRP